MRARPVTVFKIISLSHALAVLIDVAGCQGHSPEVGSVACDPKTPGVNGHLPACAAGVSTAQGPGVPTDFVGTVHSSMALSATERAAVDRANALAAQRNPASTSTIDRGFGPAIATKRTP